MIRRYHRQSSSKVAHIGFLVNTGTRDEREDEHGAAHLIEHILFKGTKSKTSKELAICFDDIGADINAYTTKEDTCIYVSFLSEHYPLMMSTLADILFNSVFPPKEVRKEVEVIKEEIYSYEDMPDELIFDDFEDALFQGHSLGRNVLGTAKSLNNFARHQEKIASFFSSNYTDERIIVWSCGDIREVAFAELFEEYFGHSSLKSGDNKKISPLPLVPFNITKKRHDTQCHSLIGNRAFSYYDDKRTAFSLLNNYLGNPGMSAPLNDVLRERHGYVYEVESSYTPYSDTGTFSIYFGCEASKREKVRDLIFKELKKYRTTKLSTVKLATAKEQLKGNLAITADSNLNDTINSAKSLMLYDKIESMEEMFKKIDAITASQVLEGANIIFDESTMSELTFLAE